MAEGSQVKEVAIVPGTAWPPGPPVRPPLTGKRGRLPAVPRFRRGECPWPSKLPHFCQWVVCPFHWHLSSESKFHLLTHSSIQALASVPGTGPQSEWPARVPATWAASTVPARSGCAVWPRSAVGVQRRPGDRGWQVESNPTLEHVFV